MNSSTGFSLYACVVCVFALAIAPAVADNSQSDSSCAFAKEGRQAFCAVGSGNSVGAAAWRREQESSSGDNVDPTETANDGRARETAEGSASSDARAAGTGQVCDGIMRTYTMPDGNRKAIACLYFSFNTKLSSEPTLPTTKEILYYAATTIHADGAGLRKRPDGVSYTNRFVPTIVSVTSPAQTHVINLLGRDITITLTATNYEYSWGDGTPNTVTTSPGLAWEKGIDPNNDPRLIRHYYTPPQGWRSMLDGPYPHENREITLTTTWSGTATNPFTGETQTINGLVTTTETTGEFPLSHLVINNTDTWEEKQGH